MTSNIKKIFNINNLFKNSKINIHSSVIQENVLKEGIIKIEEKSNLSKSQLRGNISIDSHVNVTGSILSGNIIVGEHSKIIDGVELYGNIEIGKYTSINGPNTDLRSRLNPITIGNFCSIARNVTFQEFNHDFTRLTSYFVNANMLGKSTKEDIVSKGSIIVEHDVWIGTHSVILSGVTIGTGVVVAANSVVTSNIPPYAIVGGNPAKIIKYRFDEATIQKLLISKWWEGTSEEIIAIYQKFNIDKTL